MMNLDCCPKCKSPYTHDLKWGKHVCPNAVLSIPAEQWLARGDVAFERVMRRRDRFAHDYDDELIRKEEATVGGAVRRAWAERERVIQRLWFGDMPFDGDLAGLETPEDYEAA